MTVLTFIERYADCLSGSLMGDREEIRKEQVLRSYYVSICLVKALRSEYVHTLEMHVRTLIGAKYNDHHDVVKQVIGINMNIPPGPWGPVTTADFRGSSDPQTDRVLYEAVNRVSQIL